VINTLQALDDADYEIHIFSGRSDEVHGETVKWLEDFEIPYYYLRMRPAGDFTPDEELKRQWIKECDLKQILCAFDDRDKVVLRVVDQRLGLPASASAETGVREEDDDVFLPGVRADEASAGLNAPEVMIPAPTLA
jgi:hypothetical protein